MPEPAHPTYAGAFRCIGPACEDHCCGDWDIPLDRETYERYQTFPADRLGGTVAEYVFRNAPDAAPGLFAFIYREPSGLCPFFAADALCSIEKEHGAPALSATCSIYPRSLSRVDGVLEGTLSLSCPEAARQVLLDPHFLEVETDLLAGGFRTDNVFSPAADRPALRALRRLMLDMVRDRSRPVGQRVLLLGALAQRLDALGAGHAGQPVQPLMGELRGMLSDSSLRAQLASLPGDPTLRIAVVLALSDRVIRDREGSSTRFQDTFWSFVEGLGHDGQAAPGEDLRRFAEAERSVCEPFFAASPWMLENYLINFILQHLLPFGRAGSQQFRARSASAEWVLLALRFAWLRTLLTGIAAARGSAFDAADVVRTVQSLTRATEHDPQVLERALQTVAERGLNHLKGMAALVVCS